MSWSDSESELYTDSDSEFENCLIAESGDISTNLTNRAVRKNAIHGYIYQLKVLMLFFYRGLSCEYSFRLGTEIKIARKFDDLVFEYVHNNKKVYRLIQVKHKFDESKKITVDKLLTDPKGDYNLVKYFYSFNGCKKNKFFKDGIIKDAIIYTNIDFDFDDLKKSGIKIEKFEEKDDIMDIIIAGNEKKPMSYKFSDSMVRKLKPKLKPTVTDREIVDFFNHFIFAVNQPNEEELGQILKKEIGRDMDLIAAEHAYNKLLVRMMDLSMGKNNSMFLSHEEGSEFFNILKREIPVWFNIREPIVTFTGRSEYLEKIHEILTKNLNICISGVGGVGKTELARKYIFDYAHEYDNQVVWINAESYRSATESFRKLASDKLNISLTTAEGQEKHINLIVSDVYQFFSKRRSLFIFDNAEKYKSENEWDNGIDKFLPDNCSKPGIIITSRNQNWPECCKTIDLQVFKENEAREFVEKMLVLKSIEQKELARKLADSLYFLPLALQQAVAYIKLQNENIKCIGLDFEINYCLKQYIKMIPKYFMFVDEAYGTFECIYDLIAFVTWCITTDALKENKNGKDALEILNIISYFLPENIPIGLLQSLKIDNEKLTSAISLLQQYSLVSVQHQTLSVHRQVQLATRDILQTTFIKDEKFLNRGEVKVLLNTLELLNEENINFETIDHVISIWTILKKYSQLRGKYIGFSRYIIDGLKKCGRVVEAISIGNEMALLLTSLPIVITHHYPKKSNFHWAYW